MEKEVIIIFRTKIDNKSTVTYIDIYNNAFIQLSTIISRYTKRENDKLINSTNKGKDF